MGIHRSLGLDSVRTRPYTEADIERIEHFSEELSNEKINGRPYVLGEVYTPAHIESSVYAMATDPIAYSQLAIDKLQHRVPADSSAEQPCLLRNISYLLASWWDVCSTKKAWCLTKPSAKWRVSPPQQLNEAPRSLCSPSPNLMVV